MDLEQALERIKELEGQVATLTTEKADISKNFQGYRTSAEAKEKELTEKANATVGEFETYKKGVEEKETTRRTAYRDTLIKDKAKGDKALIDKINAEYKNFAMPEDTEDAIKSRVDKASALHITPANGGDAGTGGGTSSGGGAGNEGGEKKYSAQSDAILADLMS